MNAEKRLRVLIVDDSSVARDILRSLLEEDAAIEVIAEACNGQEAIDLVQQLRPDLVTMDLNMPVVSGLQAIEHIMHSKAVPILVVSNESDAQLAYEAINYGALEVMAKPSYDSEEAQNFIRQVRLLAGVPVITRMRRRPIEAPPVSFAPVQPLLTAEQHFNKVLVIASSTGGPQALATLLPQFGRDFPAPILIAQHISDGFIEGMAQWLSTLCPLTVKVAQEGERLRVGYVYLSPSEQHLTITAGHFVKLQQRKSTDIYHPSCDVLLSSVAEMYGRNAIGLIMTGMGRDGPEGMRAIYDRGGMTLAQDEASSVIYGMNAEAVSRGVIRKELALHEIAAEILRLLDIGAAGYCSLPQRGLI